MGKNSRHKIISTIGKDYLVKNTENDEFNYPKALKRLGKSIESELVTSASGIKHEVLDIRFVQGDISILVETKSNYDKFNKTDLYFQIQAYVNYEKVLTGNKIIAILANTEDDRFKVWWGSDIVIDDSHQLNKQYSLKSFDEYADMYWGKKNDKEQVIKNTYALNELLHKHGIGEKIRSQFVGTCLLSLKNNLAYNDISAKQIISGIEEILETLLSDNLNKSKKMDILKTKVLNSQDVQTLEPYELIEILDNINNMIIPYINDKSTMGQDILNLFFTAFNKYVGKADKNQAFTPDHIVHFMCQVVGVNRHSKALDPCCGSGAFLVRAMAEAISDCATKEEIITVKRNHIFGIEYEETAFGLATTNMLIHGDGNSNVVQGNCFEEEDFINNAKINVVLMNPPYNAQKKYCQKEYAEQWKTIVKEDPSQGFHFVHYIASIVKTGKLAVLLPMQCAIGSSNEIKKYKEMMLKDHNLDAVFSLPADMFHPGANASACCMIFNLGIRHQNAPVRETFFGYYKEDGFEKRKNFGRVEKTKGDSGEGVWADIEAQWLDCYRNRKTIEGLCLSKVVTAKDEWLCEAYMETDYTSLSDNSFIKIISEVLAFKIVASNIPISLKSIGTQPEVLLLKNKKMKFFYLNDVFSKFEPTKGVTTDQLVEGDSIPYIAAKRENNGLKRMVSREENEEFISAGNCIVFIQIGEGSAGYTTYQPFEFIGMAGKTMCGYSSNINCYTGVYLATVLNFERPRYSFGRSWTGDRLKNTKVKLPVDSNGDLDWKYMEDYIKSLPYGCYL